MKLTIESTQRLATIDGVQVRVWQGSTERGVKVHCFIALIGIDSEDDSSEFETELQEQPAVMADAELPHHLSKRRRA